MSSQPKNVQRYKAAFVLGSACDLGAPGDSNKSMFELFLCHLGAPNHSQRGSEPPVREHGSHGRLRALFQREGLRQDDGALLQACRRQQQQQCQLSAPADASDSTCRTKVFM